MSSVRENYERYVEKIYKTFRSRAVVMNAIDWEINTTLEDGVQLREEGTKIKYENGRKRLMDPWPR